MQTRQRLYSNKKQLLIIVSSCMLLIEIIIFSVAFSKANEQPCIRIVDKNNDIIYESQARTFSVFNIYLFEKKYGPLDNYRVNIEQKNFSFPFRAWFCAAFCVPIFIVLMIAMILKILMKIRNSREK